jgi:hypothetical protein
LIMFLSTAFLAPIATAQVATIPVLVPVFFAGPGAFGSQWGTELTVMNGSDDRLTSVPFIFACGSHICFAGLTPHSAMTVSAHPMDGIHRLTGYFINFRADELASAAFALRVFNRSNAALDEGERIPVVPATLFRESEIQLLNIPAEDPRFRVTLRVYALPGQIAAVSLRMFEDTAGIAGDLRPPSTLLSERLITLQAPPTPLDHDTIPGEPPTPLPSSALVDLSLPAADPLPDNGTHYYLSLKSETPGVPIWAMITVTNNETQRITVITPQQF